MTDAAATLEQHLDDLNEDLVRAQRRLREMERTRPSDILDEREFSQGMWRLAERCKVLSRELAEGLRKLEAMRTCDPGDCACGRCAA